MEFISEFIQREQFIIEDGCHSRDAMIVVLEGSFQCVIDGRQFTARPGDVCVFHAGIPFQRRVLETLRCVYVQFEPFPISLPDGILKTADPVRTKNTIIHLEQTVSADNNPLTEHLIWDIFLMHQHRSTSRRRTDETVNRCIELFSQQYGGRITLDDLAKSLSISKQGLIQKFRKQTGLTPMSYLANIRLDRSKQLLKDSALPVTEIAQQCGFENVYYFSNHFKKRTGISPTDYRKLMTL